MKTSLSDVWIPPNEWTGPDPALYFSFDRLLGVTLMEGTEQGNFSAIVPGKVGVYKSLKRVLPDDQDSNVHGLNTGLGDIFKVFSQVESVTCISSFSIGYVIQPECINPSFLAN